MFNIQNKVKDKWFTFEDDEKYLLRYMDEDAQKQIKKLESDTEAFKEFIYDYVIDWQGIVDGDTPIECTDEFKRLVLGQDDFFSLERLHWIIAHVLDYRQYFNLEVELKN